MTVLAASVSAIVARQARHELGRQSVAELSVEVVGADDALRKPHPGIGVLVREPAATDHADRPRTGGGKRLENAVRDVAECLVPRGGNQAGLGPHKRVTETLGRLNCLEAEPTPVAQPALVHWFRVHAEVPNERAC